MAATCSTCVHWVEWSYPKRDARGREVGSCTVGGPTPDEGCSDCHGGETCERHAPKDAPEEPFVPTGFFEPYAKQETPALTAMTRESAIAAMDRNAKVQGYLLGPVRDLDSHWVLVKGERVMMCGVTAEIVGRESS